VGVVSQMRKISPSSKTVLQEPESDHPKTPICKSGEVKSGLYTSNGAVIGIVKNPEKRQDPDLLSLAYHFSLRYFLKYSDSAARTDQFTWAVLKAHQQHSGTVKLRSTIHGTEINFHYFNEGNDTSGEDLQSVVEGVKFVRRMTEQSDLFVKTEMLPGVAIDEERNKQFIKNEAWGITPVEPVKSDDWMTKWRF